MRRAEGFAGGDGNCERVHSRSNEVKRRERCSGREVVASKLVADESSDDYTLRSMWGLEAAEGPAGRAVVNQSLIALSRTICFNASSGKTVTLKWKAKCLPMRVMKYILQPRPTAQDYAPRTRNLTI